MFLIAAAMASTLLLSEPNIECTVVKVHFQKKLFGISKFPQHYSSINNNPLNSKLFISGNEIKNTTLVLVSDQLNRQVISISDGKHQIKLDIQGPSMSRSGHIMFNQKKMADITCH